MPSGSWGLFQDHLELLVLEGRHELHEGWRRLSAMTVGVILLFFSFLSSQHVLLFYLGGANPVRPANLLPALFYLILGTLVGLFLGKRRSGWGVPFLGSRMEFNRSLRWIKKRF